MNELGIKPVRFLNRTYRPGVYKFMLYPFSLKHFSIFFIGLFLTLTVISLPCVAQQNTATLSGHVVDTHGQPVSLLQLAIKPVVIKRGRETGQRKPILSWSKATTDDKGFFSITNIDIGASRLVMFPDHGSEYELVSIQIDDLTFHSTAFLPDFPTWFGKISFGIEEGKQISNVVVTVKRPRMRVSGRILLPNGKPLVNTDFEIYVHHRKGNNPIYALSTSRSSGMSGGGSKTDSEGYFVSYRLEKAAEYLVVVKVDGVIARKGWFHLNEDEQKDNLVFKLSNLGKTRAKRTEREKAREGVWIVNPTNGHAYKTVKCENYEDAIVRAKSEKAYLVAINDEAEQKWLEAAFLTKRFYWIGLSLPENEQTWKWTDGQPLNYTNWLTGKPNYISVHQNRAAFAMEFSTKRWIAIEMNNPIRKFVKHAIIEKENRKP